MHWPDERYVRLYVRDTLTWKLWVWESRALFCLLIRKADRAGVIDIGDHDPVRAVAAIAEVPPEVVARALPPILESGTLEQGAGALVFPNFLPAQESAFSDAQRKRESRGRRRDLKRRKERFGVTDGHDQSQNETDGHTGSQGVTLNRTEPNCTEHDDLSSAKPARKPKAQPKPPPEEAIEAAQFLYDSIRTHSPGFMAKAKPAVVESKLLGWAKQIAVGMRQDGMTLEGCRKVIAYAHRRHLTTSGGGVDFWHGNIQSGTKVRHHYESILTKCNATPINRPNSGVDVAVPDFDFTGARGR